MLKSITIDNYKTFTQKREIDFSASKYTFLEKENVGVNKILKGALFVGENASGKTNTLGAILFLLQAFSSVNTIDFSILKSFYTPRRYFTIKYVFVIDGAKINYEVTCDIAGYKKELLSVDNDVYFLRDGESAEIHRTDSSVAEKKTNISNSLLFLRSLFFDTGFSDNKYLVKWAHFLQRSLYVNCESHGLGGSPDVVNPILTGQYFEKNGTKEVNDFFRKINYRQKVYYSNNIQNKNISFVNNTKFISFEKAGTDTKIPLQYESTGNRTLIPVLLSFLHATKNDCFLIVDEFSSGLHNELEECLLRYFFKKSSNSSQIFFTTHSTNVLNSSILRPDQIYSVKFDGENGTVLSRFSERDPMPRVAQNLERMYLNGEFDGKPYYNSNFED